MIHQPIARAVVTTTLEYNPSDTEGATRTLIKNAVVSDVERGGFSSRLRMVGMSPTRNDSWLPPITISSQSMGFSLGLSGLAEDYSKKRRCQFASLISRDWNLIYFQITKAAHKV